MNIKKCTKSKKKSNQKLKKKSRGQGPLNLAKNLRDSNLRQGHYLIGLVLNSRLADFLPNLVGLALSIFSSVFDFYSFALSSQSQIIM